MVQLAQEKCVVCRADSPHVSDEDIAELKPQVPDWELIELEGVRRLRRVFRFPDFAQALEFTNAVGSIADGEGHHPRLVVDWGRVTATWWTHKIQDLHRNDFIMASKSDKVYQHVSVISLQAGR